nr:MAG TPA: Replication protein B [Caudoviricetes sp.]
METGDFLTAIFGDGKGIATIVTKDFGGNPTEQKFFQYPEEHDKIVALCDSKYAEDVYFSPILFNQPRRIKENAKTVSVIYADADSCAPENFLIEPSIVVQTSDNHWHTYWMLDSEIDPQQAALLSKKIAYAHQHQGCDISGWNTTKLLRIPNTINKKPGKNFSITAKSNGVIYSVSDIESYYGDVVVEPVRDVVVADLPDNFPKLIDVMGKLNASPEISSLYLDEPGPTADLSKLLWKLEIALFKQGLTAEEVYVVARNAKCNKYHRADRPKRSDADGDLWREVQRAEGEFKQAEPSSQVAVISTEPIEFVADEKMPAPKFLTDEEMDIISQQENFIDKYVGWATSKTDGALSYQIASGFTLLSCVFSDIGYAVPRFGKMGLNLWFMVLGETTLTRKSTSRNLMLRAVRQFEKFSGYQIDIGSDATPEGLTSILAERDKQTSLLHRDEVQGMFKDFINKTYMASAAERFTELYDGHVPVTIRSSKGKTQTERAETNFVMYLMGITSKTADILTTEYFRSGFLARFIYVTAPTPPRTKESEDIQQADEYEVNVKDEVLESMIKGLSESVMFWQKKAGPKPKPIRLSDASLDRFNQFKWEMGNYAEKHPERESIEPSRQRLALSVWKCAVLLAMYERSEEVQLRHLLTAIYYSQDWFSNLVYMAGAISASEWQRDVDKLEAYIMDKGGSVRYEEAYKKFSNKRKREFDEMIQALQSQARVQIVVDNRKSYLEVIKNG